MATAAVVDAGRKDKRRYELDRQINEAKGSLAELMEQSSAEDLALLVRSSESLTPVPDGRPKTRNRVLMELCQHPWEELLKDERARSDRRKTLRGRRAHLSQRQPEEVKNSEGEPLQLLDRLIRSEEKNPAINQREPINSTQFSKFFVMIDDLINQLLQEAYETTRREFPQVFFAPPSSINSASAAIRLLRSDGYPRYDHPTLPGVNALESRRQLNDVIRAVLGQWDHPRRQHHVAKICYNLLVCPVPPGIHNYNALIAGFTALGEHSLAKIVVDSFFMKSRLRATEATMLCLLEHYRLSRDVVGFYNVIRRLHGHDPRGLRLRRRNIGEVESKPFDQAWAHKADVSIGEGSVTQRACLEQKALTAILRGLLDFGRLQDAAKLFLVSLRERRRFSMELLERLLSSITTMIDYAAARILLSGLLECMSNTTSVLLDSRLRRPARLNLRLLLQMGIRSGGMPAVHQGRHLQNVDYFVTLLFIRDYMSSVAQGFRQIQMVLGQRDLPLVDRLDVALRWLRYISWRQDEDASAVGKFQWLVDYDALHEQTVRLLVAGTELKWQFRYIVATSSSPAMQRGALFGEGSTLDADEHFGQQLSNSETFFKKTSLCFVRNAALARNLKFAVLEVLPPSYRDTEILWAPGMTVDGLPLDDLLDMLSGYLATFPIPKVQAGPREAERARKESLMRVDYFVESFSGMMKSYAGPGLVRTTE